MSELNCPECGMLVSNELKVCHNCGYPLHNDNQKEVEIVNTDKISNVKVNNKKNVVIDKIIIMSMISFCIGVIIVALGISLIKKDVDIKTYSAESFDIDTTKFGADFYTEIYAANDTIVDELSSINGGIEALSILIKEVVQALYFVAGMIIIAIGLVVISNSCSIIGKSDFIKKEM